MSVHNTYEGKAKTLISIVEPFVCYFKINLSSKLGLMTLNIVGELKLRQINNKHVGATSFTMTSSVGARNPNSQRYILDNIFVAHK